MPRGVEAPPIDRRKASDIYRQLRRMVPHYTPEWPAEKEHDPGLALADAFSAIVGGLIDQLNRAPRKNLIEFLNMLGMDLLPARPATVPVRFSVNPRLEDAVLVRAAAQCIAPGTETRPVDLPFETERDLLAVPSLLRALVAVDPAADAIYTPPAGFLELDEAARPLPPYETVSFAAAGATSVQLDRVDELEPGAILRVRREPQSDGAVAAGACCPPEADPPSTTPDLFLVVVGRPEGRIVTVATPLPRDLAIGTGMERVTDFAVFDSLNLQDHILYLGHAEVLSIESAAEIDLRVRHLPGTSANLSALPLAWEYGAKPESGDGVEWRPFEVLGDTTNGFRSDGVVRLRKSAGEIIETEIATTGSRWLRARVRGPIPAAPPPGLPRLDGITFAVRSAGEPIAPDALFHNDAAIELSGQPFGPEPRQFDRFYIGSEEVFTKRGADVNLDVTLVQDAQLATPAALEFGQHVHVFARGPRGRLVQVTIPRDPAATEPPLRTTHEELTGTSIGFDSEPAMVATSAPDRLCVFVRAENGQMYLRFFSPDADQWSWVPLGSPAADIRAVYDPAAALDAFGRPQVFTVGSDLRLYSRAITPSTGAPAAGWVAHGAPSEVRLVSSPAVASLDGTTYAYVADPLGTLHELALPAASWSTVVHSATVGPDARAAAERGDPPLRSRVRVLLYNEMAAEPARMLAYRTASSTLVAIRRSGGAWQPEVDLGSPGPDVASAPAAVLLEAGAAAGERLHLFVRGAGSRVWHRSPERWESLDRPGEDELRLSPAAILSSNPGGTERFMRVFSAEANRLAEYRFRYELDAARGGPPLTLVLDSNASDTDDAYTDKLVHIRDGTGSDAVLRPIAAYGGADRVVRLDAGTTPWPDVPRSEPPPPSMYRILDDPPLVSGTSVGFPASDELEVAAGPDVATLQTKLSEGRTFVVLLLEGAGQLREVTGLTNGATPVVQVDVDWNPLPGGTPDYRIHEVIREGPAGEASVRTVALATNAESSDDFYAGATVQITRGPGEDQGQAVESYSGAAQVAILEEAFDPVPEPTSMYEVLVPRGWFRHQDPFDQNPQPDLSWEYWNGTGWLRLPGLVDETDDFHADGAVRFRLPDDIEATTVAGQENMWIRARLLSGDYGREVFSVVQTPGPGNTTIQEVRSTKEGIDPPTLTSLTLSYELTVQQPPERCITYNNLSYLDQTTAARTAGLRLEPFFPLEDRTPVLYLGFDKPLVGGPIGVLFVADELRTDETDAPRAVWSFRGGNEWKDLKADDGTAALTRQGIVAFNVPEGFQLRSMFGQSRYWIRASLAEGRYLDGSRPRLTGVFPNAVSTIQAGTIRDEILGSSNGEADQSFTLLAVSDEEPGGTDRSVVGDPEIRVRESLSPEEREEITAELGDRGLVEIDVLGEVETWVLWTEVDHFFDSDASSRHYHLDRALGELRFGDGRCGRIPPGGVDNVRAFSYRAGGGEQGNVGAGEVDTLVTAVAGVDSVRNPVPADGGGDRATVDEMLELGPARISHRRRAVTAGDFEWLAREASTRVARARCRPNFEVGTDPADTGRARPGRVTVYVVPRSTEARPRPSIQLQRVVQRYLADAADSTLSAANRIAVRPPRYVPVSVEADVVAVSLDRVAAVERAVDAMLRGFLHPLTGGPEGAGWEFGRPVTASDLFVRLEEIDGVDHVRNLRLHFEGGTDRELARIEPDELIAWADPKIRVVVG